ncbi:MAG: response regulator [Anaerolineae bacterium]|nr:response regulator [Anaerolineae bacterium]
MSAESTAHVPGRFVRLAADALRHYYDSAYLAAHPVLVQLSETLGTDRTIAVQRLRRMLLDAVEGLRPEHGTPPASPAWRPYRVLHGRYILAKGLDELEAELGLSRRQIQREQRSAFAAVAMALWAKKLATTLEQGPPGRQDAMSQEISRVASEEQVCDAARELEAALQVVRALAEDKRVELVPRFSSPTAQVVANPDLLRQLLVSVLSLVIRVAFADEYAVRVEALPACISCVLYPKEGSRSPDLSHHVPLPDPVLALAQANGAMITQENADGIWRLLIELRPAPESHTVVIVEDNTDLVRLYSRYLAGCGYRLIEISDSATAVQRIAEIMPDAVVLDLMMSRVDGWQILQSLRSDPSLRSIPVAVCSVLNEPELARSLGADAYLRKPVRPPELLECLTGLLERRRSVGSTPPQATR